MKAIQTIQIRRIYALLKALQLEEQKAVFVPQFTDDRTDSVGKMTEEEAESMCDFLAKMEREKTKFEIVFNETLNSFFTPSITKYQPHELTFILKGDRYTGPESVKAVQLNSNNDGGKNPEDLEGLRAIITKRKSNNDESAVKMRKKTLHVLGNMGYTKEGKFDYERINALIENIGANNPTKAKFNYLTNEELNAIVTQVEQIYKKFLKKK